MSYIKIGRTYRLTDDAELRDEVFEWVEDKFANKSFIITGRTPCEGRCHWINDRGVDCDGFIVTNLHDADTPNLCPYRTYIPQFIEVITTMNDLIRD